MTDFRTGNGADWLDLLATLLGRYRAEQVDQLADPPALRAWLREHRLPSVADVTVADLEAARELREALHRMAVAALDGRPVPTVDVTVVSAALAGDEPLRLRADGDRLRIAPPATAAVALARLARQAITDLTGPNRERLRACGDGTCSGVFLDQTGRRRWCSDERCGVRARVRAHRVRAREREQDRDPPRPGTDPPEQDHTRRLLSNSPAVD